MPTYRDEAVVLRTHKLGEADRIITMLSRGHGKVRAVAKGVRRTSSKFGARLEPFSHVDLQFAEGRTLDVVTQVESLHAFGEPLTSDYPGYTAGQAMLETADRLVPEVGEPALQQYQLLVGALKALGNGTGDGPRPPTMILDSYFLRALAIAGYAPSFSHCARCGVVGPHQAFSPATGGAVCERCRPAGSARPAPATFELLGALLEGRWEATREVPAARGQGGQRADLGVPGLAPGPRAALAGPRRALSRTPAMSFQPPAHWSPPATYRPPRYAYVIAALLAVLLVAALAVPVAIAVLRYRGDWPPTGSRGVPPTTANGGANGAGDPYFPDYGSSGYDATQYTVAVDFDPGDETLTGRTVVAARATESLSSFYLDLALPASRVWVDDVDAAFALEGFQDLRVTPAAPIADGQSFTVTVEYAGRPGTLRREGMDEPPWRAGEDEWTVAGEPESSAWWYPANDHPSDPALLDVSVRVPKEYQAISVGRLASRDTAQEADFDTWRWVDQRVAAHVRVVPGHRSLRAA